MATEGHQEAVDQDMSAAEELCWEWIFARSLLQIFYYQPEIYYGDQEAADEDMSPAEELCWEWKYARGLHIFQIFYC